MKYSLQPKDDKAMTIAEILVSIFILALVAAVILPGLLFGYKQVYESGNKSSKVYTVQKEMEEELITTVEGEPPDELVIKFGNGPTEETIVVKGKIVEKEEEYDSRGNKTKAKVFIPQQ